MQFFRTLIATSAALFVAGAALAGPHIRIFDGATASGTLNVDGGGAFELTEFTVKGENSTNIGSSPSGEGGAGAAQIVLANPEDARRFQQWSEAGTKFRWMNFRTKDQGQHLIIKMKPVYITSYQTGGSSGDDVPVDTFSLNFGAIKFEYEPQR